MKVELIDYMGDDLTVVNAARVSFNKESDWEWHDTVDDPNSVGFETLREKDQKLIQYLAKHGHWTPFSHVQIQMREKVPLFVARQRFKHMVGFSYNELSRRYVDDPPEFYIPDVWRGAPIGGAKQGSSNQVIEEFTYEGGTFRIDKTYEWLLRNCEAIYSDLINEGVAPEQARMVLPQSMYTSYYCTGSLAAWGRAYKLRSTPDAQAEIRELANQWDEIISGIPELKYSWAALKA